MLFSRLAVHSDQDLPSLNEIDWASPTFIEFHSLVNFYPLWGGGIVMGSDYGGVSLCCHVLARPYCVAAIRRRMRYDRGAATLLLDRLVRRDRSLSALLLRWWGRSTGRLLVDGWIFFSSPVASLKGSRRDADRRKRRLMRGRPSRGCGEPRSGAPKRSKSSTRVGCRSSGTQRQGWIVVLFLSIR